MTDTRAADLQVDAGGTQRPGNWGGDAMFGIPMCRRRNGCGCGPCVCPAWQDAVDNIPAIDFSYSWAKFGCGSGTFAETADFYDVDTVTVGMVLLQRVRWRYEWPGSIPDFFIALQFRKEECIDLSMQVSPVYDIGGACGQATVTSGSISELVTDSCDNSDIAAWIDGRVFTSGSQSVTLSLP